MPLTEEQKLENKILRQIEWMKGQTYDGRFNKHKTGVASLFQKLVRLSYADEDGFCHCVTCSKRKHYKELQGGHFIGRKNKNVIVDWRNVWPQCVYCNDHLSGNTAKFREFLSYELGETQIAALESKANAPKHGWLLRELAETKVQFAAEIRQQEKRIERNEPALRSYRTLEEWRCVDDEVPF